MKKLLLAGRAMFKTHAPDAQKIIYKAVGYVAILTVGTAALGIGGGKNFEVGMR